MIGMVILSFLLGYPLFILTAFLLAKVLFPDLDKQVEEQKREKQLLMQRAQRVKRSRAYQSARSEKPGFTLLPQTKRLISQ